MSLRGAQRRGNLDGRKTPRPDIASLRSKRQPSGMNRPIARAPTHPGELMREILDDHVKLPIAEAARRMKVSRPSLYAVLNGRSTVTAEMALRFSRLTGGPADLYLQMQTQRDLWLAEQRLHETLVEIEPAI
jgi:addiction module HigA family antidote